MYSTYSKSNGLFGNNSMGGASWLSDKTTINGMTLQNRLVRSATWEGMCEQNGKPMEKVVNWYRELARIFDWDEQKQMYKISSRAMLHTLKAESASNMRVVFE
jgi:hypothetical protein